MSGAGKKRYPTFRPVKTVGALRRQLERLPDRMPLSSPLALQVVNQGSCPDGWDPETWRAEADITENF